MHGLLSAVSIGVKHYGLFAGPFGVYVKQFERPWGRPARWLRVEGWFLSEKDAIRHLEQLEVCRDDQ